MEDMQRTYDEELSQGNGLMSLFRSLGDITLGEDIMDNLPMLMQALRNTNKDTLTMEQRRDMSGPIDESSLLVQLSNTPGLSEKIGDEVAMALGMAIPSPAGKGKALGSLFDMLKDSMDPSKIKRYDDKEFMDFQKASREIDEQIGLPRDGREGFDDLVQELRDEYMDSPEALEKALRTQRDIITKADRDWETINIT